jgi:hypothetical protein
MKVCLEDTKAVMFAIIGGLADGRKVVLAEESQQQDAKESWVTVLWDVLNGG